MWLCIYIEYSTLAYIIKVFNNLNDQTLTCSIMISFNSRHLTLAHVPNDLSILYYVYIKQFRSPTPGILYFVLFLMFHPLHIVLCMFQISLRIQPLHIILCMFSYNLPNNKFKWKNFYIQIHFWRLLTEVFFLEFNSFVMFLLNINYYASYIYTRQTNLHHTIILFHCW